MPQNTNGMADDGQDNRRVSRAVSKAVLFSTSLLFVVSQPAAAQSDTLPCEPPEDLSPLFSLLEGIIELLFITGVGVGTIGFILGGIYMMLPGDDSSRKGKTVWKYTLFGTLLVLSSQMVMEYMLGVLSPGFC